MRRLLLVDDDPIVLKIYRDALARHEFDVQVAQDGVTAIQAMRAARPDVVVLDLMMPRLSGADVLKFMRSQPGLEQVPVIVLSNAYMDALTGGAAAEGAQKGLVKTRCTPALLLAAIHEALEGFDATTDISDLIVAAKTETTAPDAASPPASPPKPAPPAASAIQGSPLPPVARSAADIDAEIKAKARLEFIVQAPARLAEVRKSYEKLTQAKTAPERALQLEAFYRRVHFLATEAGFADARQLALLASALEALLMQLMDNPARITTSTDRTLRSSLQLAEKLAQHLETAPAGSGLPAANVLVVDDDAISNRLVVSALRRLGFHATSFASPLQALDHLRVNRFDLLLLDVQMPGMNGFEFFRSARRIPGYEHVSAIYVTGHTAFEHLAQGLELGAEDLIGKPVLPMELAVKVAMHLLRRAAATSLG